MYFVLLLKQVCMCDQWLVLDLLRSGAPLLVFYDLLCCIKVKEPL
jgi:hypothetical protein